MLPWVETRYPREMLSFQVGLSHPESGKSIHLPRVVGTEKLPKPQKQSYSPKRSWGRNLWANFLYHLTSENVLFGQ